MLRYVVQRIILIIPLLFIISLAVFCLAALTPSDTAEVILRVSNILPTPEAIAATRQEFGLDQGFWTRYLTWLKGCLVWDFGVSYTTKQPVTQLLYPALCATLWLVIWVLCLSVIVVIPLGILFAVRARQLTDKIGRFFTFACTGMPDYWLGLLLMWVLSVKCGLLPLSGMESPSSVILPALTLSAAYIGLYVKLIRNSMLQQMQAYHVYYTKARGLKSTAIIIKHIFPHALHSSLTAFCMSIPRLIAGSVVVEYVFAWPGMGYLCVEAIKEHNFPVIQAYVLLISLLFIAFNLLADILQLKLNPRLRMMAGGQHV